MNDKCEACGKETDLLWDWRSSEETSLHSRIPKKNSTHWEEDRLVCSRCYSIAEEKKEIQFNLEIELRSEKI